MNTISVFFRKKRPDANSIEEVFNIILEEIPNSIRVELPYSGASVSTIYKNIKYAKRNNNGINHITGDIHYIAIALGKRTVLTIHDIGSAKQKNPLRNFFVKLFWFWLPALCVSKITVISEFTKKELSAIIPFAKRKIGVIHNPVNPQISYIKKNFNSNCPVILHIGTKENKNLPRTITALTGTVCKFIIIGRLNAEQQNLLSLSKLNYENYFDLDYTEIVKCYNQCDIVSFPSIYEGFGVPVLEGNAAGRPVVAGDIPAIREVAGNAACLVNPYDVISIRNGFQKVITDASYRETLVSNGFENVKRFSPEKIANQYQELYKEVAKN
jgi:glycosyltransferase involved in cell wall biosynthesis